MRKVRERFHIGCTSPVLLPLVFSSPNDYASYYFATMIDFPEVRCYSMFRFKNFNQMTKCVTEQRYRDLSNKRPSRISASLKAGKSNKRPFAYSNDNGMVYEVDNVVVVVISSFSFTRC